MVSSGPLTSWTEWFPEIKIWKIPAAATSVILVSMRIFSILHLVFLYFVFQMNSWTDLKRWRYDWKIWLPKQIGLLCLLVLFVDKKFVVIKIQMQISSVRWSTLAATLPHIGFTRRGSFVFSYFLHFLSCVSVLCM